MPKIVRCFVVIILVVIILDLNLISAVFFGSFAFGRFDSESALSPNNWHGLGSGLWLGYLGNGFKQ